MLTGPGVAVAWVVTAVVAVAALATVIGFAARALTLLSKIENHLGRIANSRADSNETVD